MLIAQLTDPHVMPPSTSRRMMGDTTAHLARAVAWLCALVPSPDVVVLTGDLVDGADPVEYGRLRDVLLPLPMPHYVIPGNHDRRVPLRAAFPDHAYLGDGKGPVHYAIDEHAVRLIGFDSTQRGLSGGVADANSLAWLNSTLSAAPERPTVMLLHHPPFRTGMHYMDAFGFINLRQLRDVVLRHPQLKLTLSGHVHRAFQTSIGTATAWVSPSTAPQVVPELFERRLFWLRFERPSVSLHEWDPARTIFVSRLFRAGRDGAFVEAPDDVTRLRERGGRATRGPDGWRAPGSRPIRPT
jgi:Icc protein